MKHRHNLHGGHADDEGEDIARRIETDIDGAAARNGGLGDQEQVQKQLDPVLRRIDPRAAPVERHPLSEPDQLARRRLGLAGIERGLQRARCAEGGARPGG